MVFADRFHTACTIRYNLRQSLKKVRTTMLSNSISLFHVFTRNQFTEKDDDILKKVKNAYHL